jgi:hypothetical protein
MTTLGRTIINAVEGGDIEAIRHDGLIQLLIDLKPVLSVPANRKPRLAVADTAVEIPSGDAKAKRIECETVIEALEELSAGLGPRFLLIDFRNSANAWLGRCFEHL